MDQNSSRSVDENKPFYGDFISFFINFTIPEIQMKVKKPPSINSVLLAMVTSLISPLYFVNYVDISLGTPLRGTPFRCQGPPPVIDTLFS